MKTEFTKIGDGLESLGIITQKKYLHLKRFEKTASEAELKMISDYENYQKELENSKPVFKPKTIVKPKKLKSIKPDFLFKLFQETWVKTQKKELILNEDNQKIIFSLCQYFGRDSESKLDLKKGLMISGGVGIGKTSMMMTFHEIGKRLVTERDDRFMWFKPINCNDLVSEFEDEEINSKDFHDRYKVSNRYFDDFGTERIASKFGKVNIMQEILEKRYLDLKWKTHITTNLTGEEIFEKYGFRVFDRLFEQFNFIEMNGNSFRSK